MADQTKALLPVTQADRDAAADLAALLSMEMTAHVTRKGKHGADQQPLTQAFARHRISHSLPGDVGMREALADIFAAWDAHVAANDRTNDAIPPIGATRAEREVYAERYKASEEAKRDWFASMHRFVNNPATRAALTPSPCPGDVGMLSDIIAKEIADREIFEPGGMQAAIRRAAQQIASLPRPSSALVEALEPFARLEIPTERVGNAGFYSIPFDRIERAKSAIARAALTPSPCPGDVGMREAREAFFDLIADARKWEEVHDEEAIHYTLETTHASLIPLMNALGIEQQYQPIEGDGESFPGYESPADAIDRAMGRAALTPSALSGDAGEGLDFEGLGDALGTLSHKLRMSGFLVSEANHTAYEKVVAEFQALSSKKGRGHA